MINKTSLKSRISTVVAAPMLFALLCPAAARACAVCMGGAASNQRDAVNAGLLSMLGVMAIVFTLLGYFVARMVMLARRADGMETLR